MPGVDCKPTQLVVFLYPLLMLSLICVPHIRSRHPPYPAAVLTTLSPGLSSQLLSHTAVSLVHLSCLPLFCFISTLLTSLTSSYVSLLFFLSAPSDLSLSACSFSLLLYFSPPHTYFLSVFLLLSLSAILFVISPINVQFPSCLFLGGNERFLHEMWNFNLSAKPE